MVRPVMGLVRSRFLAHLPTKPPVHPRKIRPKSFIKRILPVTPTCSRFCIENLRMSMKTRIRGEGGGVPTERAFPRKEKASREGQPSESFGANYFLGGAIRLRRWLPQRPALLWR